MPNKGTGGMRRSAALARILHFENTLHRRLGNTRPMRYLRLFNYYTAQNLPPDNVEQPLGINLFKAICDKHCAYLWGQWQTQWQKDIVTFRVKPRGNKAPEDDTSQAIHQWIKDVLEDNKKNALLYDTALDASVYGDAFLRLHWNQVERRVEIEHILPEFVHCRWNVTNMDKLTEVIVSYPIDRMDAQEQFGTAGNPAINYQMVNPEYMPGFGIYWEHWTPTSFRVWIDDILIQEGPNPYMYVDDDGNVWPGIIPFVHIPNMRVGGEFWGWSDGESMLWMQDELNRRMADLGDTVNIHAHPIVTLSNYHGESEDLPVGPDAIWDLGREGKAEILSWKGPPEIAEEYINLVLKMIYDVSNMPEVAFGRSTRSSGSGKQSQGSSSGIALQLALMPIVERATQKRIFWDIGLRDVIFMAAFIHWTQDPKSLPFDYTQLRQYEVRPIFASVLPRDRMQIVNEQVALVNGIMRSRERALEELGEENIGAELARIWSDAQKLAKLGMLSPPVPGGKNSDRGNGGSNANPGGPGASSRKPGAPVKGA